MKLNKKLSLLFCVILLTFLNSCYLSQSEDDKIKDAFIGKAFEEDFVDDEGDSFKNIRHEFFNNGKFSGGLTFEIIDDETYETTDLIIELYGEWSVRDKFLYYTYDYDKLKTTPEIYGFLMKDALIKELKEKNTPFKVI